MNSLQDTLNLAKSNTLTNIFDLIGFNYSVIDLQGNYIIQNNTAISNISGGNLNAELIDPITWNDCKKVMEKKARSIKEENFKERCYLSIKQPLLDSDNSSCIGILIISHDITKQKQAHIAKQAFLQNMAHDIRTPLSGIIGLAQLQEMGLGSLEESKEYGQMIYGAGNQLLELLNAVIELIDTEHMKDPVKAEPLDLSGLARELCVLMEPSMRTKGLTFKLELGQNLPLIISDRIKLKRILLNILSNSVKFTQKGEISFSIKLLGVENNQASVAMVIFDTGVGIAKENLDKIYDCFYRAHPSYLAEYSGYGMGLYLVKETVALLGGEIKVSSEEGKGTCFTLHFNFSIAHTNLDETEPLLSPVSGVQSKTAPVLIAEDNPIVLRVLKNLLKKAGYKVIATMDGRTALEALQKNSVAWALLDIGLPELRGTEATRQYRQWEKENNKSHLPIFALTGHSVDDVGKECSEAGIDQVFTKPLNNEIIQEIEKFVLGKI